MAIYSAVPPPEQQPATQTAATSTNIEAWVVSSFQSLSISSATPSGSPVPTRGVQPLSITLDNHEDAEAAPPRKPAHRPKLIQRDSQRRREALLKGKEGSRRRQRWENDHLLHVPNVQPPLPSDWEVHPTYPVHEVPYYLAPLWDAGVRHRAEAAASQKSHAEKKFHGGDQKGRVPQELRQKLKKSKGAKSLLQELEEEVRKFVQEWERKESWLEPGSDSDDDEIVFVGRNGLMSDEQRETVEEQLEREKLVFDSLADDHGASFGRWLVHSIATYYGLTSRSVTVGDPARREAYVGIRDMKSGRRPSGLQSELPRPLYGLI